MDKNPRNTPWGGGAMGGDMPMTDQAPPPKLLSSQFGTPPMRWNGQGGGGSMARGPFPRTPGPPPEVLAQIARFRGGGGGPLMPGNNGMPSRQPLTPELLAQRDNPLGSDLFARWLRERLAGRQPLRRG